jgi:hypothetical protein
MKALHAIWVSACLAMQANGAEPNPPISVEMSMTPAGMGSLTHWSLSIQTNGTAQFIPMFEGKTDTLVFSVAQMSRLAELVATNGILNSGGVYGEWIGGAHMRKIRLQSGSMTKIVEIRGLHNWSQPDNSDHMRLPEVVPALQVWDEIEGWLVATNIVRFQERDKRAIEMAQNLQH